MLPELENVLNDIGRYYNKSLLKRYSPDPEPAKQDAPAQAVQSGPAQPRSSNM